MKSVFVRILKQNLLSLQNMDEYLSILTKVFRHIINDTISYISYIQLCA